MMKEIKVHKESEPDDDSCVCERSLQARVEFEKLQDLKIKKNPDKNRRSFK